MWEKHRIYNSTFVLFILFFTAACLDWVFEGSKPGHLNLSLLQVCVCVFFFFKLFADAHDSLPAGT